jgi:hypothetical protein
MKHQSKARYPAPVAVVMKMFTDPKFHSKKLDQLGVKYKILECKAEAKEFRIRIERKVPMDAPALIRKLLPAETTVINEETWNPSVKTGRVKVEPQGVPVQVSCSAAMKDEGGNCVITYDWDISARVPLVGGPLEKFVVADMDRRLEEETRLAVPMLKDYR